MKVLEEGKWKNPWSGEYVCCEKSCGAKLLVEENDLLARFDKTDENYFVCPICGRENNVPRNDLPLRLKEKLNKKRKYYDCD
ncbi:hypothetical protein A2482_00375 [Candidatus Falkowbacteria bacterium RIFOXYC2_FULL_48_21]|uniref:Uncharacterized protein n=1 Tax=Candidatus Falkowbacteria bacterium RIFOXYC2_FULL_48_21 TaxID=1798005 RepID=A0A1F5TGK8_9BACT|nr:MAG: hypothetical protein A2482_00375 [Candidatus Falkowbacteria bacterium RIFOXYC2_FULL_48_21]